MKVADRWQIRSLEERNGFVLGSRFLEEGWGVLGNMTTLGVQGRQKAERRPVKEQNQGVVWGH